MIPRFYQLSSELESSVFLFGARQTGKSIYLGMQFPNAVYIDLLDAKMRRRFRAKPELLYEMLQDKQESSIVVIDEIPLVPELLNEVHRLIQQKNLRFVLCGSSARKLKRKGHDTLGGRALPCYFYPFVSAEIAHLDLDKALLYGMLPPHYLAKNPERLLDGYIDVYLREEIKEESLVRNLDAFERFMEVAATCDGEIVNYENIASDCQVSAKTVKEYFGILSDTLIGYTIPAYTKVVKRKVVQAPKFYYFDVGVYNHLLNRTSLAPGTSEYGHCFEHFVIQELVAYIGYTHNRKKLTYWHTYNGKEVDAVIGEAEIGIEIKSTDEVQNKHMSNFKEYLEEFPNSRSIVVSRDPITRRVGNVEVIYIFDFLRMLWNGELF
jgi:predicted AAA+ superfamily ATPase